MSHRFLGVLGEGIYQHALSLAKHYRAKLVAQHVVELWQYPSLSFAPSGRLYDESCRHLTEKGKEQLQKFVRSHTHDEVQSELVVQMGNPPDFILSLAQSQHADVIVMGTHGRRGYDHLMLGSVTERVMRSAYCLVLAVCGPSRESEAACQERDHVHHVSRILFCTDFSENSDQAFTYALSVRAEYEAELTLLHVLEDALSPTKMEKAIATATERLAELVQSEASNSLKIRTVVRIGKAYRQIVELAVETQSDMVVMGVRGRGALDLAVFDSTTYRVMQLGPCPVLAVHL